MSSFFFSFSCLRVRDFDVGISTNKKKSDCKHTSTMILLSFLSFFEDSSISFLFFVATIISVFCHKENVEYEKVRRGFRGTHAKKRVYEKKTGNTRRTSSLTFLTSLFTFTDALFVVVSDMLMCLFFLFGWRFDEFEIRFFFLDAVD